MVTDNVKALMETMDDADSDEERKFILTMHYLNAGPSQAKRDAKAALEEFFPDVEPWNWVNAYTEYCNKWYREHTQVS